MLNKKFFCFFTDTIKGFFTLFSGKASLKEISGPVGIFKVVGEVSKFSLPYLYS